LRVAGCALRGARYGGSGFRVFEQRAERISAEGIGQSAERIEQRAGRIAQRAKGIA